MRTFWRRWVILNRIYHFIKSKGGIRWVNESEFLNWVMNIGLESKVVDSKGNFVPIDLPLRLHMWRIFYPLFNAKNYTDSFDELRNILRDLADPDVALIKRESAMSGITRLNLSTRGEEVYAISSLIFFSDYGRKIWTGVIVGLLILFFTDRLKNSVPSNIKTNYEQQQISKNPSIYP